MGELLDRLWRVLLSKRPELLVQPKYLKIIATSGEAVGRMTFLTKDVIWTAINTDDASAMPEFVPDKLNQIAYFDYDKTQNSRVWILPFDDADEAKDLLREIYEAEGPRSGGNTVIPAKKYAKLPIEQINDQWDFEKRELMHRIAKVISRP